MVYFVTIVFVVWMKEVEDPDDSRWRKKNGVKLFNPLHLENNNVFCTCLKVFCYALQRVLGSTFNSFKS